MVRQLLAIAACVIGCSAAVAQPITIAGPARVKDGDTISIGAQVIRLHGIDAFENGQNCERRGRSYNCGAQAENLLRRLVAEGVACVGHEFDRYDRLIARCKAGEQDIGAEMVRAGQALAYRRFASDYIGEEDSARTDQRGAWAGAFEAPWDFRAARWEVAVQAAPDEDCPIKGNINRQGERIYHAPWSRSYQRTRINTENGERWFCSEAEALAAGWRAPFR